MFPRYACAINDGAQVVITGGFDAIHHCPMNNVSVYSMSGFQGNLPNLTERRQYHACSRFTDQYGQNVKIFLLKCVPVMMIHILDIVGDWRFHRAGEHEIHRGLHIWSHILDTVRGAATSRLRI